ncbi:MAG TPA: hypothetical protein VEB00_00410 [Clostridia bacterium]|nr:hypothetical protein [Clostridia bacterium]
MASNNEYKRYFIILQEDDKGYELSPGKIPTGYVKIEVKNSKVRLNAFIQNVKIEDRIEYRLILVSSGKKQAIDVGKILIDSSGRGELSYELESDNVLKSGLNIGDFTVAAVTAGATVPLSGYTGRDKLEWKGRYEVVNRQKTHEAPRIDKKIKIEEIVPEIPAPIIPVQPVLKPEMPPIKEAVMKPEPNIEAVMKPEPNIEAVMKPEPNIEAVMKPEPNIEAVMKPEPNIEAVMKPEPNIEAVMKPEPNIEAVMKPEPNIEAVMMPEPNIEAMPIPKPNIEAVTKPEPEPPVMEHMHVHETKVEVEIVMPKCPPMAPIEEPYEFEEEKIECEDISQYYCDEDDSADSDDSDDDERPKHHHEEYHHERAVSPYYSGGMYSKMKKVLRRLRRYEPFEEERGFSWFKVGDDIYEINNVAIPYMGYMVPMGYPFMAEGCSMMMDRKDYILGVKYDGREDDDDDRRIRYLLFGVPALYSKKNEQYYKSKGFMEFKPHKSKGHGYFIMCLDIRNGMMCHID